MLAPGMVWILSRKGAINFCLGEELFIFVVLSLVFDGGKKIICALDRVIPCQDLLFLSDF